MPAFLPGSGAPSNILQLLGGYLKPLRGIGGIIADAVIEEDHLDYVQITEHPVERGANIADHAFLRPAQVTIWCAWSNSSPSAVGLGIIPSTPVGELLGWQSYVQKAYQTLLGYQASRTPVEVFTGKRLYKNMVIVAVAVVTDRRSEFALIAHVTLREVIIVETQSTTLPPKANQADPAATAGIKNQGTQQAIPFP